MKIETERDRIRSVAKRWRGVYGDASRMGKNWEFREVGNRLEAMDLETATKQEIDSIVGNSSWTEMECSECGESVTWTVQVGQEPDYESRTAWLCKPCVLKLVALISEG